MVIIDVLRASSVICTALEEGVKSVIPVASLEEARNYNKNGYIVAAERKGDKVEGFDIGNSPSEFYNQRFKGRSIVLTTSNGTNALQKSNNGQNQIIIGCFLNGSKVVKFLENSEKDALLICAGWRNYFNMEDSLFAGYLCEKLDGNFNLASDSALAMQTLYQSVSDDIVSYLANASHPKRLKKLNLQADFEYCLSFNKCNVLPVYTNGELIKSE